MENLIFVCGPRGAGKETILTAVLSLIKEILPSRIVPFTTREKRESETHGVEYLFISLLNFLKIDKSDILYCVRIGEASDSNHYFSGTLRGEFQRHTNGIIDITVEGARILSKHADHSLFFYVWATEEERCKRIMLRQNISEVEALKLMSNEPSPGVESTLNSLYPEFIILRNHDGKQEEVVRAAVELINEFLAVKN